MKRYGDLTGDGGSNVLAQLAEQQARLRRRMAGIRRTAAVVSGKGGVGKSSITANLAAALAAEGYAVGVLDADLNGPSLAKMLGVREQALRVTAAGVEPARSVDGIRVLSMDLLLPSDDTPVVWDAPTRSEAHTWRGTMEANALREFLADTAWGALDLLLLDLPPGADRLPTVAELLPGLSGAVVVTIPSEVSHLVVKKSVVLARETGVPLLGLVENMAGYVCLECGALGALYAGPGGERTAAELGIPFLGRVPFDPRLATGADRGRPFVTDHGATPTGRALREIAGQLAAALFRGTGSPAS
ncbi:MAG: P-loop NTPase [Candidatus Rokubacteria bacterium]|nr:P-loop NTPase [Candidatus Rokubacteria bacterium]